MTFTLTGDDVPESGTDYVIHLYNSTLAVTVQPKSAELVKLVEFDEKGTQRWNCQGGVDKGDPLGFACGSAFNGFTRYLGFNNYEKLYCDATTKNSWEYFYLVDAFGGGFKLMMKKDDHHAPVDVFDTNHLMMLASSNAVFGITKWKN